MSARRSFHHLPAAFSAGAFFFMCLVSLSLFPCGLLDQPEPTRLHTMGTNCTSKIARTHNSHVCCNPSSVLTNKKLFKEQTLRRKFRCKQKQDNSLPINVFYTSSPSSVLLSQSSSRQKSFANLLQQRNLQTFDELLFAQSTVNRAIG